MTTQRFWRIARIATVMVSSAAVAIACQTGVVMPASVDQHDPTQVIQAAVQTMFSWQPGKDSSAVDAFIRARPYLSAPLAAQRLDLSSPGNGTQWHDWAVNQATITAQAQVAPDEHPPDTSDTVHRVVAVTQNISSAPMGPQDAVRFTVWVTAINAPDGWRVDSIEA